MAGVSPPPPFLDNSVTLRLLAILTAIAATTATASTADHPKSRYLAGTRTGAVGAAADPEILTRAHTRGNMELAITNDGTFGTFGSTITDPVTGDPILSCVYPKGSDILYLYVAAFWIGAVVGRDTLVSCGSEDFYNTREFWPEAPPLGDPRLLSSDQSSPFFSEAAISEEDILVTYYDTLTNPGNTGIDEFDGRPHRPLGIQVSQRSMVWSYDYADDFVLFDYQITNIGNERLRQVYMGIWVDGDVWHESRNGPIGWEDDIVGFYETHPAPEGCGWLDTVNIAWTADNDGDPVGGAFDFRSARNVVGVRVVRTPADSLSYSFNWWITNYSDVTLDFGPRRLNSPEDPFRDMGPRIGTPLGDANKYYVMRKPEFDYDLLYTAVNQFDNGWRPPPEGANVIADGFDTRYLLSFGPFGIDPGQTLPLSFAFVGGENLHRNPEGISRFDPANPQPYYDGLDFSNLALNARWASWVYDNPSVDSDGDGNRGKYRVCPTNESDTAWYEGDGVPDFRGAGPPPAPAIRVIPQFGRLVVRFNGYRSETTPDVFLNDIDFEGYRVYRSLDERRDSYSLLTSYDRPNFKRFRFVGGDTARWIQDPIPFDIDSLETLYGSGFQPLIYSRTAPFRFAGDRFYFERQDYNRSSLGGPGEIRKVFPDLPQPADDPAMWQPDEITMEYGEPLPLFYEYEYVLDSLLPTIPYYVAVTAFDFGAPASGLSPLETNPQNSAILEYPQVSTETVETENLDAYVYPNPYRVDADYGGSGFEDFSPGANVQLSRRIRFANLPRVCTIRIFSLDGDLIKTIDHNFPEGGPGSMVATWDLVTRNRQAVVSGTYYYTIESPTRTQVGKLVIIR